MLKPAATRIAKQLTHETLSVRYDDVDTWIELLIDEATSTTAEPTAPEVSPLEARKADVVGGYLVHGVLGHGASARVLEVERDDGRRFALKVSLGPDHDARLAAEARALARLRHPRIVQLEGPPEQQPLVIGGRPCLLMSLAGVTLQRQLAEQGSVSLDFAARYGTDLLSALEHLEEEEILHRDIKPANVGVGALQKKASSLTLFDFSLAGVDLADVRVGTAAYRDPEIAARGRRDLRICAFRCASGRGLSRQRSRPSGGIQRQSIASPSIRPGHAFISTR